MIAAVIWVQTHSPEHHAEAAPAYGTERACSAQVERITGFERSRRALFAMMSV